VLNARVSLNYSVDMPHGSAEVVDLSFSFVSSFEVAVSLAVCLSVNPLSCAVTTHHHRLYLPPTHPL
jgi:hypothetical protein